MFEDIDRISLRRRFEQTLDPVLFERIQSGRMRV